MISVIIRLMQKLQLMTTLNTPRLGNAYIHQWTQSSLVWAMVYYLTSGKPRRRLGPAMTNIFDVIYSIATMIYTARQLFGINQRHRFASQLEEIFVNINTRFWYYSKDSRNAETNFYVGHHVCPVPISLLSQAFWFPQLPQRQCDAFVLITFSCKLSL